MSTDSPTPEIPWPVQVRALVACAYTCRDCGRSVVADEDPVVRHDNDGRVRLERLVVLCKPCGTKRDELEASWPPITKPRLPTDWSVPYTTPEGGCAERVDAAS